ncbi:MAG: thioredoxin domain-containing protein [Ilumatobacteraceae bacterium]
MTNRLANASSPYLRQHRDNPVDWYQWGDEAFAEAARTGKPILLSVGYSACHWCHVMAHESFEDVPTAEVMNELFVNVKVDREERPDVDSVYMDAVQALTGRGGWPMTVFCTPTGEPFYGGTYYPRDTFVQLMNAVDDAWRNRRDELQQNVDALVEAIGRTAHVEPTDSLDTPVLVDNTVKAIVASFDAQWGGFGGAPKFPSTFALDLAMRISVQTHRPDLMQIVTTSLDAMAAGGMYDHLGGGFSRYSVDQRWLVPHFEKMLYDEALLLRVYIHAWLITKEPRHRQVAEEVIAYVLADLSHPDGGFYSAEDADSLDAHGHSEEGAFYTWSPTEVREVLGNNADAAMEWWDIEEGGNFEGLSIPNRIAHRGAIARPAHIETARLALLAHRSQRHRPGLDNKVLTEWNAMMLSSLCEAASAFDQPELVNAAQNNARFLISQLRNENGVWLRSWQADAVPQARHAALAHDLAHVVDAMTRMYELTAEVEWLDVATATAHQLLEKYWDNEHGGLFTVADDAEQLVVRQKDLMDNATPSANSVAAMAFLRLAAITGEELFRDKAMDILKLLARVAPTAPTAFCHAIGAAILASDGTTEVVIPGHNHEFLAIVRDTWRPDMVLAWGAPTSSPLWEGREIGQAYVCRNHACLLPASSPEELTARLATNANGG